MKIQLMTVILPAYRSILSPKVDWQKHDPIGLADVSFFRFSALVFMGRCALKEIHKAISHFFRTLIKTHLKAA